jgi:protein O-mannosyl-transferase
MSDSRKKSSWPKWALPGLALLALLAHGASLANGFTNWDDPALVTQNPRIQSLDLGTILRLVPGRSYQPIRELSHALDLAVWGQRPFGHHALNLLLHIAATLLLAQLLLVLLRQCEREAHAVPIALVVAALFAVHPVNVEAVAWVSSRKYGLAAVGIFGACLCHLCRLRKTAVIAAAFAMLSSPFGIVLPALIISLDCCRFGKAAKTHWKTWLPIGICALGMLLLMRTTVLADTSLARENAVQANLASMGRSLFDMLQHLLLPVNLGARYLSRAVSFTDWRIYVAFLAFGSAVFWAIKRRDRVAILGLAWFAICWAPVSGLVPISTFVADRYCYLPGLGLFLAAASPIARFANSAAWQGGTLVLLLILSCLSIARSRDWQSSETLWRAELAREADHEIARYNLALTLLEAGKEEEAKKHLRAAIDIRPSYVPPYLVLGKRLGGDAGLALIREAVRRSPQNALALAALGEDLVTEGDFAEGLTTLQQAVTLDPNLFDAYPLLARANLRLGHFEEALRVINYALMHEPGAGYLLVGRGMILAEAGQPEAAVADFRQVSTVAPEAILRLLRLNARRAFSERPEAAISALRTALLMRPEEADLHAELASALFQAGDVEAATLSQQRAVALAPNSAEHLANLGGMLAMEKRFTEARTALERALTLDPQHAKAKANLQLLLRDAQ